jgi:hypothetical protein
VISADAARTAPCGCDELINPAVLTHKSGRAKSGPVLRARTTRRVLTSQSRTSPKYFASPAGALGSRRETATARKRPHGLKPRR